MAGERILVVEDENIVARDIQSMLGRLGYSVPMLCSTGEEALQVVRALRPDLILMDIMLSKGFIDGIQVADEINRIIDAPVVYLTAFSDRDTIARAQIGNSYGYVLKPIQQRDLRIAIEMALYKHKSERQLRETTKWLATTLRCVGDALIATDSEGRIKFMNSVAESMVGLVEAECVGALIQSVFQVESTNGARWEDPIRSVLTGDGTIVLNQDVILVRSNGERVPIMGTVSSISDDFASMLGAAVVFRDVTEMKRYQDKLWDQVRNVEAQKRMLEVYFPENLVDYLVDQHHDTDLEGKNVTASLMFFDVRGSTRIAEQLTAGDFANFLSNYFSGIMELTYANGGSVNKMLGDGMLITFGCPFPEDSDAVSCVRLALQVREYTRAYNENLPEYLREEVRFGIGISTGSVFAGNVGYQRRMDYTVLGDSVNTASRLEKMTKKTGRDILIDRGTFECVREEFEVEFLGSFQVRGKSATVQVYAPTALI